VEASISSAIAVPLSGLTGYWEERKKKFSSLKLYALDCECVISATKHPVTGKYVTLAAMVSLIDSTYCPYMIDAKIRRPNHTWRQTPIQRQITGIQRGDLQHPSCVDLPELKKTLLDRVKGSIVLTAGDPHVEMGYLSITRWDLEDHEISLEDLQDIFQIYDENQQKYRVVALKKLVWYYFKERIQTQAHSSYRITSQGAACCYIVKWPKSKVT